MIPKGILGIDSNIAANECFWMYFKPTKNNEHLALVFFFYFLQKLAPLIENDYIKLFTYMPSE